MATRRPPWAGTAPITLLVKAGVPAPARAAAMKVEAFINTPSWPFGNYLLQPNFLVVRGVTSVARRVLAHRSHVSRLVAQAAASGRFRAEAILSKWRKNRQYQASIVSQVRRQVDTHGVRAFDLVSGNVSKIHSPPHEKN